MNISGLAPYNFICVQAGYILSDLRAWNDIFDTWTLLKLCSFAVLPLAYAIFVRPRGSTLVTIADSSIGGFEPVRIKMETI